MIIAVFIVAYYVLLVFPQSLDIFTEQKVLIKSLFGKKIKIKICGSLGIIAEAGSTLGVVIVVSSTCHPTNIPAQLSHFLTYTLRQN